MNPNGLIPVLRDRDVFLWESAAIVRYLGAQYGSGGFWPADPLGRAKLDKWAEWMKTTFGPQLLAGVFWQLVATRPEKRDEKAIAAAVDRLKPLAAMLDARLAEADHLGGAEPCFADIIVGAPPLPLFHARLRAGRNAASPVLLPAACRTAGLCRPCDDLLREPEGKMTIVPTLDHLRLAQAVTAPAIQVTPLVELAALARQTGAARVFVKPECLQWAGSFKVRGAYWRLTRLSADEARRGVVAYSSGNFAQGLAAAGQAARHPRHHGHAGRRAARQARRDRWLWRAGDRHRAREPGARGSRAGAGAADRRR